MKIRFAQIELKFLYLIYLCESAFSSVAKKHFSALSAVKKSPLGILIRLVCEH
jgi:hypothetical protein